MTGEYGGARRQAKERRDAGQTWTVTTLMGDDLPPLPDISVEIPVAELYEGVDFTLSVAKA